MKILYRSAGVLLLSLMLFAAVTFSSSAAFHDVYDSETARALELLDTLGLVNGYPDGGYHPDEPLTRAQFCKFAVLLMELEDQLMSASQKTLFTDVTSVHWAAPYVNLAYSKSLIQGYGNGYFGPDDNILYEQAVLISLRILGYDTNDYGNYYPDDPLRFAEKIGLTSSLDRIAGEALSRGETARLLYALLSCTTKKGEMYAASLADRTVKSVILLDEHTASPTGLLNCARFYASGSAVWYPLAAELPADWVGAEGTALLNSDGELIAFLPNGTSYKVVDGILLSASYRAKNASGSSGYYVKLHTGKGVEIYPRANTISTNLVGSSGTLILNDTDYATAFISDDSTVYNLTDEAILISTNAVSDTGITGCAEFRIGGKTVWFRQSFYTYLPDSLIGSIGTVMYDDNDTLVDFLTDGTQYSLLSGIIVQVDSTEVTILADGNLVTYHSTVSLSSQSGSSTGGSTQMGVSGSLAVSASQVGSYGMFMLNEQNYIVSFTADSSEKYTIKNGAILLSANSGTGYNAGAKFYVDNKATVYAYSTSFSGLGTTQSTTDLNYLYQYLYGQNSNLSVMMNSTTASQGTLLLDSENKIVCFIPDGTTYRALSGVLVSANNSSYYYGSYYYNNYVSFSTGSQTYTFPQQQSLSGTAGSYGTLLLTSSGYAVTFIPDSSDGYSSSAEGILLSVGKIADDGKTMLVKIYANGNESTYQAAASIPTAYIGQNGRLILDSNKHAVGFIPETDVNTKTSTVSSATSTMLMTTDNRIYAVSDNLSVIFASSGYATTWKNAYILLTEKMPLTLHFNDMGSLSMIIVHDSADNYSSSVKGILLSDIITADDGKTKLVKFYVNGNESTYLIMDSESADDTINTTNIGEYGQLLLDSNKSAIGFIPETNINTIDADVLSAYAAMLITKDNQGTVSYTVSDNLPLIFASNGQVTTWKNAHILLAQGMPLTLHFNDMGSLTMIIVKANNPNQYTTTSAVGILLSEDTIADDGITHLVHLYVSGSPTPYVTATAISSDYVGQRGHLVLNSDGHVIGFNVEEDPRAQKRTIDSVDKTFFTADPTPSTAARTYSNLKDVVVLLCDTGTKTTWEQAYTSITKGKNITLYFNDLGGLSMIVVHP